MRQLKGRGARPYNVTPTDLLWLLRAVQAEGPDQRQVAAVLLNGFVWNRAQGGRGTLTDWVRAYAQPVNPRWFEGGDLHEAKLAKASSQNERNALVARAQDRERVHSTRRTFSEPVRRAVRDALFGRVAIDPRAVDYAAPLVASNRIPLEPDPGNRNRLYTRSGAESWTGYLSAPASSSGVLLAAAGALLAGGAYYAATRSRRA